jgi:hypothetical protein
VYDLVGNRLGRTVIASNGTLDTTYDYYPGTDRLYHEYQAGPVAAIPLGRNETVYAYHTPSGGLSFRCRGRRDIRRRSKVRGLAGGGCADSHFVRNVTFQYGIIRTVVVMCDWQNVVQIYPEIILFSIFSEKG